MSDVLGTARWHTHAVDESVLAASSQAALPLAALIAAFALVFTVASFWWLNARQGRLKTWEPLSFAGAVTSVQTRLRFPLVMHNTGPKPIVVQDLRLSFPDESPSIEAIPWTSSRAHLRPDGDDALRLPAGFAVSGRAAEQLFIEFGSDSPRYFLPEPRDYRLRVEARLGHLDGWQPLLTFTFHAARLTRPSAYVAYRNRLDEITEEERVRGAAALNAVAVKVQATVRGRASRAGESEPGPSSP